MNMPPPLMHDDAASSSSSISSPPQSPPQNVGDEITVARRFPSSALGEGVVDAASATPAQPALAHNAAAHATNGSLGTASNNHAEPATKPKRQRKAAAPKSETKDDKPVKEKKTRKPREPKVKKEGEPATASRKRQKTEDKSTPAPADAPAGPRQSTLTEMVTHFQPPGPPASAPPSQPPPPQLPSQQQYPPPPSRSQQPTPSEQPMRNNMPPLAQTQLSNPPTPRPFSSGQNYDPIRGSTIDAAPLRSSLQANGAHSAQASPHVNRASASPSITSLIDPHPATTTSAAPMSYSSQTTMQPQHHQPPPPFVPFQQQSPTPPRAVPLQVTSTAPPPQPALSNNPIGTTMVGAMDIDDPACVTQPKPEIKIQSKSSSSAPTPKPVAVKTNSPPRPAGSGLLSSSDLFGGPSSNQGTDRKGIDIEIRISLNPGGGNQINMAQEIARKYGANAINPRAAAHRERLLQVAAAQHKIDGGSTDDMSVDLMSEMDGDSNVEMGGIDEEKSNTGADDKPVRKRRKKVEEYDKEDDFIDDAELAWQEKAAVAKDGFFVYSGPLVPEGQAAQIESTAPTRGGRGGRRGRRAGTAAGTTHAQLAEKKEASATTGRGRGRARGTGAPRKPRVTKADRERMEAEKAERERTAGAGTMVPASTATANTPAMGATPALIIQQQQPPPHPYSNGHPPGSATQAGQQGLSV